MLTDRPIEINNNDAFGWRFTHCLVYPHVSRLSIHVEISTGWTAGCRVDLTDFDSNVASTVEQFARPVNGADGRKGVAAAARPGVKTRVSACSQAWARRGALARSVVYRRYCTISAGICSKMSSKQLGVHRGCCWIVDIQRAFPKHQRVEIAWILDRRIQLERSHGAWLEARSSGCGPANCAGSTAVAVWRCQRRIERVAS